MDKLVLENVYKNYGEVEAVKGLSFTVKDKEFLSIVGPSGCGKSSTLRMIAGLEVITRGEVLLDGQIINNIKARDRDIALAFESYALYPHLTAYKNLAFPLQPGKLKKNEIDERVKSTMALLHLEEYRDMKPGALSGGQQQRISLGRALIRQASIYLLDEPLELFKDKIKAESGIEIILNPVAQADVYTKLKNEFVSGTGAFDLVMLFPLFLPEFVNMGNLRPMDDLLEIRDPKLDDIITPFRKLYCMYDD